MARLVSRTLLLPIKYDKTHLIFPSRPGKVHRFMSSKASSSGKIIEIDLGSSSTFEGGDGEAVMMKKMEELIQRIIVQRSTPDWLPFMPGSSFWVPPGNYNRPGGNLDDLFSKLRGGGFDTNTIEQQLPLTDEQEIAFFTLRGWPSSHFEDHHDTQSHQDIEVTLEVKVLKTSGNTDDEDK